MADMPDLENDISFNQKGENDAPMEAGIPITTIATGSEKRGTAAPESAATSGKGEKPEIEAEPPSNTYVKGLEKDSKGEESPKKIDADQQVSVTLVTKTCDTDDQVSSEQGQSAVGREQREESPSESLRQSGDQINVRQLGGVMGLEEEASPEALRQSEEEQKQSKANSLLKRDSQDTVDDTFASQAKKPKLFKTQHQDQEM